ncbi:MAG: hypothetical protein AAF789_03315, partial [Bacteroidota bacterium]
MKANLSRLSISTFLVTFLAVSTATAQTGPAGLRTTDGTSDLELWLRADQGVTQIDALVSTWADISGNGRNMEQTNSGQRPSLNVNAINGKAAVNFNAASNSFLDGVSTATLLGNTANKPTQIADIVIIFQQPPSNSGYISQFPRNATNSSFLSLVSNGGSGTPADNNELDDLQVFIRDENGGTWEVNSSEGTALENSFTAGQFHAVRYGFDPTDVGSNDRFWLYNYNQFVKEENSDLDIGYDGETGPGGFKLGGTTSGQYYDGEVAEILIFSSILDSTEYIVLQNYLNARYDLNSPNDFYAGDETSNGDADFGVIGLGQRGIDGSSIAMTEQAGIQLTATAGLDDGDYLFAGYTAATQSSNAVISNDILLTSGSVQGRLKRAWYLDKTDAGAALVADITFDFNSTGTDVPDLSSAALGGYKLLYRAGTSGAWTVASSTATAVNDANKTITFGGETITNDGYYALATDNSATSPIGDIQQTWYSFQSGSWGDPNTWTLDGATTPVFDNDDNEVPGAGDNVIITSGRTVRMYTDASQTTILDNVSVQSTVVRSSAELQLLTSSGNDLGDISGAGTIALQGSLQTGAGANVYAENLPAGDYEDFADQLLGGTIELSSAASGTPLLLNQDFVSANVIADANGAISRSLTLNMDLPTDRVIVQRDVYLTRNLTVTQGQLQFHRNNATAYADLTITDASLDVTVVNDLAVGTNGSIRTGTANQRHQLDVFGNATFNGTAYFTQRTAADISNEATDGIVDLNFLNQATDQTVACNAEVRFYRIEIDKSAPTVFLNITSTSASNFNLFGFANDGFDTDFEVGGVNQNAFALVTGGVSLGTNVDITTLSGSDGNYCISALATMQLDGGSVRKTGGPALVPYGTFILNSGLAEFLVRSGITLRDAGRIEVNGGELFANAIRTSIQATGDAGSYLQTGGDVILNGGSGQGKVVSGDGGTNDDYYVLSLAQPDNVFRMTGGNLTIQRSNYTNTTSGDSEVDTDDLGGSIFINSDPANFEVTGGTVVIDMDNGNPAKITSKAPFFNLTLTNSSGLAISDDAAEVLTQHDDVGIVFLAGGQAGDGDPLAANPADQPDAVMTAQPLVVLNDFVIGDATNVIRFDHLGNDVTIGRNFTIELEAQYYFGSDDLLPRDLSDNGISDATDNVPASHQNTT